MNPEKDTPLVSVLLPYYNELTYIEPAIKSVLGQTWPRIELIVVDDCSPDPAARLLIEALAEKYQFTLLRPAFNQGASKSLMMAFEASTGGYISIIAHDDLYPLDRMATMMKIILANDLDALQGNGATFTDDNLAGATVIEDGALVEKLQAEGGQKAVADLITSKDTVGCLLTTGALYKRRLLTELAWIRRKFLLDDWPFTIKVWQDYKARFVPYVAFYYRSHAGNTHRNFWKWFPARVQVTSELIPQENKVHHLGTIFNDVAHGLWQTKDHDAALRLALAACFLYDGSTVRPEAGKAVRTLLREAAPKTRADITAQMQTLLHQQTFSYKIVRGLSRLVSVFIWNKKLRKKIRSLYP